MALLTPLYGGGYWVAFRQLAAVRGGALPACRRRRRSLGASCLALALARPPSRPMLCAAELLSSGAHNQPCLLPLQTYYAAAVILHYVVPRLLPVKSVQKASPRPGQVAFEALYSIGAAAWGRGGGGGGG